jgi:hypothetical protein
MPFSHAARKFSRAKWVKPASITDDDIPADAITGCLRTTENKLSFWECTRDTQSIEEIVIALATGSKFKRIEKMHLIALPQETLRSEQLGVPSKGDTLVDELRDRHFDLTELTLNKLTKVAKMMESQIESEIDCHSFTAKQVAKILNNFVEVGKIKLEKLDSEIQVQLRKLLS